MGNRTHVREITPVQGAANKIKGLMATLDAYRRTSMRFHGVPIAAVSELAATQLIMVDALQLEFPESVDVARWYNKFYEYVEQYDLV